MQTNFSNKNISKMSIHKDALTSGNKKEGKCKIYKKWKLCEKLFKYFIKTETFQFSIGSTFSKF